MWTSKELWSYILGLFFISALLRLLPHPPNMTPIGGISILSGVYLRGYIRYLLPIIPMILSDLYLGFSSITLWVYLSFMTITLFTSLTKSTSIATIGVSSLIFFFLSNLGVWSLGGYTYTIQGLITCYVFALPFLLNTLIGDLVWTKLFESLGVSLYRRGLTPQEL